MITSSIKDVYFLHIHIFFFTNLDLCVPVLSNDSSLEESSTMEPQTNGQQSDKPPEVLEEETVKIQVGDTSQETVQPPPKLPPQPSLITPSLTLEEEAQQKLGECRGVLLSSAGWG